MRLSVKALVVTCALLWGLSLFIGTWWIIVWDGASAGATFVGKVYRGYTVTPVGSLIGLLWGLVDGAIGGALFGWIYNAIAGRGARV